MALTIHDPLGDVPRRNAKAELREGETPRRNPSPTNLTPRGALVDQARKHAGVEVKQMAAAMGVSESFLLRGFKDQEHISWQRLQVAAATWPAFHRAFLILQAREIEGVDVITEIRVPA